MGGLGEVLNNIFYNFNLYYDFHNTRTQEVLQHNTLRIQSVLHAASSTIAADVVPLGSRSILVDARFIPTTIGLTWSPVEEWHVPTVVEAAAVAA